MIIIYILHNNKFIFTSLFSIKDAKKFKFLFEKILTISFKLLNSDMNLFSVFIVECGSSVSTYIFLFLMFFILCFFFTLISNSSSESLSIVIQI